MAPSAELAAWVVENDRSLAVSENVKVLPAVPVRTILLLEYAALTPVVPVDALTAETTPAGVPEIRPCDHDGISHEAREEERSQLEEAVDGAGL